MTVLGRMHWLNARDHAGLLTHAICGDWLSPPDQGERWFAPMRVSRGDRVLLFCYEADETSTIGLCAVLPRDLSAEWVLRLRGQLAPRGAETKWAHFVGQLGRFPSAVAAPPIWSETEVLNEGKAWRARRPRHPSALIDRLLTRDRMDAEEQLHAALNPAPRVGDIPREAQRAIMGDKRVE